MTFDPNVPNAGQSPGIFPPQNNTNFARLKTIINADHIFNDTAQPDDGIHRQVTLTPIADPTTFPTGAGGVLYLKNLGPSNELFFFNGVTRQQLTPYETVLPIRHTGTENLAGGDSLIFFNPSYNWAGTGWAILGNSFRFYNVIRNGAFADANELDSHSGSFSRPTLSFSGTGLRITNNESSSQAVTWSIIVNRIS